MKLSFTTLGCPNWTFEKIVAEAERIGYEGIEIRGVDGIMRADEIPVFSPEQGEATKEMLSQKGITLMGFGSSVAFHDDAKFEAALCMSGEGDVPIADIVRQLKADGYDGWYSLEWEKKWHPELPDADVVLPVYKKVMESAAYNLALEKKQSICSLLYGNSV